MQRSKDEADSKDNGHKHVWLYCRSAKSSFTNQIEDYYRCKDCPARTHCPAGKDPEEKP